MGSDINTLSYITICKYLYLFLLFLVFPLFCPVVPMICSPYSYFSAALSVTMTLKQKISNNYKQDNFMSDSVRSINFFLFWNWLRVSVCFLFLIWKLVCFKVPPRHSGRMVIKFTLSLCNDLGLLRLPWHGFYVRQGLACEKHLWMLWDIIQIIKLLPSWLLS